MPVSLLNAGHGGTDSGAVANGLIERDINMIVAKIAKELMEYNGITVPPIISGADLNEVIRLVNKSNKEQKIDIAHSIHHNAGGGNGSETIHSINYGNATIFAKILQEEFDKLGQNRHGSGLVTKLSSDGVHDYYGFIRNTDPSAVISEFAFLDTIDSKIIDTYEEQYAEAEAIAKAHCRYYGITYKSKKSSTISPTPSTNTSNKVMYRIILDGKQKSALSSMDIAVLEVKRAIDNGLATKGIVQRNTDSVDVFTYEKSQKQKSGSIIFSLYKPDLRAGQYLADYMGNIKAVDISEMTQEIFESYETIIQVGGQKYNSNVTLLLSGEDRFDTIISVLKYIKKI